MTTKRKAVPPKATPPEKPRRDAVQVEVVRGVDNEDDATARKLTRPEVSAAAVMQRFGVDNFEVNALIREMTAQAAAVNRGDMSRPEAMLIAQAHTLDCLFANLTGRAHSNMGAGYLDAAERYMRLALKAQSQCRTTLEALAEIKSPRAVAFVRQANIAHGPQQVNNGVQAGKAPAHGNNPIQSNKLLEVQHGEYLDTCKTQAAISVNSELATVGEIHRATD